VKYGLRRMLVAFATVEGGLVHNMIPRGRIGQRGNCPSREDAYVVRVSSDTTSFIGLLR